MSFNLFFARKKNFLFYLLIFSGAMCLYFFTALRGFGWQDSGEFQYRIISGDYRWCQGIARAHPLYIFGAVLWSKLFPAEQIAFAANTFSGLGMASALLLLAAIVKKLTKNSFAAIYSVALLGFSQMAWWMSTTAEVYTWSVTFLLGEILLLLRYLESKKFRWLAALFFVNGLHFSIHNFALLSLAVWGIVLLLAYRSEWKKLLAALALAGICWGIGSAWILYLAAEDLLQSGDWIATVKNVLFGYEFEKDVLGVTTGYLKLTLSNYAFAAMSLVNIGWLVCLKGFRVRDPFPSFKPILIALTLVHFLFWARYFVEDQATFIIPTLSLLAIWAGIGANAIIEQGKIRRLQILLGIGILFACALPPISAAVIERAGIISRPRKLPGRREFSFWLTPWKQNERSAQDFVQSVGSTLRKGDLLIADNTAASPLLAARAAGLISSDWEIFCHLSPKQDSRPLLERAPRVFVVSPVSGYFYHFDLLNGRYTFKKDRDIYQILVKEKKDEE